MKIKIHKTLIIFSVYNVHIIALYVQCAVDMLNIDR